MDNLKKDALIRLAAQFVEKSPLNYLTPEQAVYPNLVGLRLYDAPILGFASVGDSLFEELRRPEIIGEHFCPPRDWLPKAASVISFFLPLAQAVRQANRKDPVWPAQEWLHGRSEGQRLIDGLSVFLRDTLIKAGYSSVVPSLDARFWSSASSAGSLKDGEKSPGFTSNWSERHIAYVCGLGTFGLSAGLITKKGMAGRFSSVITALSLPPDTRPYQTYNEYCVYCGACIRRCPVHAISLEKGKSHEICGPFVDKTRKIYDPRYGCGKCQVAVPCEIGIPNHTNCAL